jgi:hypothetical protein
MCRGNADFFSVALGQCRTVSVTLAQGSRPRPAQAVGESERALDSRLRSLSKSRMDVFGVALRIEVQPPKHPTFQVRDDDRVADGTSAHCEAQTVEKILDH